MSRRVALLLVVLLAGPAYADSVPGGPRLRLHVAGAPNRQTLWCVAFSPDGKTVAVGASDKRAHLFDAVTGRPLRAFGNHIDSVWTVAFSPDGKLVASGGRADFPVRMWDPATGGALKLCDGPHRGGITRIIFFRDNPRLIMSGGTWDPTIRVWDVPTRTHLFAMSGHADYINAMDLAGHERTAVTVSMDRTLRLWDLTTGRETFCHTDPDGDFNSVAFSPDGRSFACAAQTGRLTIWETAARRVRISTTTDGESLNAVAYSPDGRLLACAGYGRTVRLFDARTGEMLRRMHDHSSAVRGLAFSPDGRTLASCDDVGVCYLWDVKPIEAVRKPLTDAERLDCWSDLAADPRPAGKSAHRLALDAGDASAFLAARLAPVPRVDVRQTERWVGQLDNKAFAVRDRAYRELEKVDEQGTAVLRRALAANPSPEARRRLERLLDRLDRAEPTPERLRELRAIDVLERRGDAVALAALRRLAGGGPDSILTIDAADALRRRSSSR